MPTLKVHYDGWIALPVALRQTLGLNSGDRVEADVIDGALVLRPAGGARGKRNRVASTAPAAPSEPSPDTLLLVGQDERPAEPARAARQAAEGKPAAAPKRRGRPPKAKVAAPPRPADQAPVGIGAAKLIMKAEIERSATLQDAPPAPVARFRPERIVQTVERRPFRNVEIRPLGPGRGHNAPRRLRPGSGA
jgi:bifunctional DNA-binding transcriptional regulator/antitoxin component of YhaV-PrlF toxin-antitoxin module